MEQTTHEDGEETITGEKDLKNRSFSATAETRLAYEWQFIASKRALRFFSPSSFTFMLGE